MDGGMWGISLGAIAATGALLAATPANAHTTELLGDISATGGVTVTWHGDPARGCAAAGLCGYSGSAGLQPVYGSYDFFLAGGRRLRDSFSYLDTSLDVTRVKRVDGSGEGACVDAPDLSLYLTTARAGAGRGRLGFDGDGLSPGRCAGPDIQNVLALLPRHAISLSRLKKRSLSVDMSGRASFG